ncbi:putative WD repeat-containing protein 43-like [Capsicum annuum]|nr:putative WD repeat-containing protein 43-like [Capsicum annuum]
MKSQALADHLAVNPIDEEYEPLKTYFPEKEVSYVDEVVIDADPGWRLFFYGAVNMKGVRIEYEACILGLRLVVDMGVQELLVLGYSNLFVHQIQGDWEMRDLKLIAYRQCFQELCQRFVFVKFRHIPKIRNEIADALATLSSMLKHPDKAYIDPVHIQSRDQHAYFAGLLKSKRTREDWESVAKDVTSFVTNDLDERCSRVLGLSYNHLTSGLKTCLLHFGIFLEDSEIPTKKLMRSWMAEWFLKLEKDLEGEAEKCLQELVDRCLVLICKKSRDGTKIRLCKVHDLIYDLCVREIQRENIFIMNEIVLHYSYSDSESEYLSMQKMQPFKRVTGDEINYCPFGLYRALLTPVHRQLRDHDNNDLLKRTRSIFPFHLTDSLFILKSELIHFKLLRVLELRHVEIDNFPLEILSLIWLSGKEWYPNVRGFTQLKVLLIEDYLLEYWKATDDNFLVLERLVLKQCRYLKEIPIEFAEIPTLQLIELTSCLPELGESAARIQQEQEELGNNPVDIRISDSLHDEEVYYLDAAEDDDDDDSDVDVAEDDDNEDSDADATEHNDNYDLNWLFNVQCQPCL